MGHHGISKIRFSLLWASVKNRDLLRMSFIFCHTFCLLLLLSVSLSLIVSKTIIVAPFHYKYLLMAISYFCYVAVEEKISLDGTTGKEVNLDHFIKPPVNLVVLEGDCLDAGGDGGELESFLVF